MCKLSSAYSCVARSRDLAFTLLLSLLLAPAATTAQSPQAHNASCQIDTRPYSEADLARFHGDSKRATDLYAAALKTNPADGHSHQLQVDMLLAQGKIDDALKLVDAWTKADPTNPYAIVTASDVQFDQGHWREAYALALKALKVNPCFAPAYQNAAQYESLAGYHATARKHLTLAHQLAPNDEDIKLDWAASLGGQATIDAARDILQNDPALDKKQKKDRAEALTMLQAETGHNCELASVTGPAIIPMVPISKERYIGTTSYGLEVAFNRHKRVLQIDTGASGLLLSHTAEGGMGLKPLAQSAVYGMGGGGASGASIEQAESIRIGGLEFKDCRVTAMNNFGAMGGSHLIGQPLDNMTGLIGTNIFSRYLVTLDYIKHEIRLDPLPQPPTNGAPPTLDALGGRTDPDWIDGDRSLPPSLKSWTEVYRRGHQLFIPTLINSQNPSLFLIDTGSEMNLVDFDTAKKVTKAQTGMNGIMGLSGSGRLDEAGKFTLDFAGLRMPVISMDALDLSRWGGVHGFLGYPTLSQLIIHIDYRDNLVLFEAPQGKKL
jgi:tetratricopeptide (TPR) repeat protein